MSHGQMFGVALQTCTATFPYFRYGLRCRQVRQCFLVRKPMKQLFWALMGQWLSSHKLRGAESEI